MFVDPGEDVQIQGDIFTGIPFIVHLPDGKTISKPDSLAMLLSHECDLAKPANEVALLAPVQSGTNTFDAGTLGNLRSNRIFHAFHLGTPPGFEGENWYADFRFITAVHKGLLHLDRRLVSLDEAGREGLRGQLIKFWNRDPLLTRLKKIALTIDSDASTYRGAEDGAFTVRAPGRDDVYLREEFVADKSDAQVADAIRLRWRLSG